MLLLSLSPSTYNHRFIDDLQNYMQDFEMRLNADLDLHYVAIGTPDSIEAVGDTSPTNDEGGSQPYDDDQVPAMQAVS